MISQDLTLSEAIKTNRLPEFIEQAEKRLAEIGGTHPEAKAVEAALAKAIRTEQSEDRT